MARIRTLKPEFWADEKLSLLDPITRLVFLGLVSLADDAGRLIDNVKQLDGQLFPSTDDTCRDALDTLARMERIIRYQSASGQHLLQIANWSRHQRVDKPSTYVLPAPPSGDSRETLATPSRSDLGPTTPDQRPRSSSGSIESEAGEQFDSLRTKLEAVGDLKHMPPETITALPARTRHALAKIGGHAIVKRTAQDKLVWLRRDFVKAYAEAAP